MPLIGTRAVVQPPVFQPPVAAPQPTAAWIAPDGTAWDLCAPGWVDGITLLAGVTGLGAAPRVVTSRALSSGGVYGRWSHADMRTVNLPLLIHSATPDVLAGLWSGLTRAFTQTTPPAAAPTLGQLQITRPGGFYRQASGFYVGGMEGSDDYGGYPTDRTAVVQLACPNPWWYGPGTELVAFDYAVARNYYSPYLTVSPDHQLGVQQLRVDGDLPTFPVWTLTGPASGVTITLVDGPSWTYTQPIAAGRTVTVDTAASTVVDDAGVNQIGALGWPGSQLFALPAGVSTVQIDMQSASVGSGVHASYSAVYESA